MKKDAEKIKWIKEKLEEHYNQAPHYENKAFESWLLLCFVRGLIRNDMDYIPFEIVDYIEELCQR